MKRGRPTLLTPEITDEFCRRIASGRSVLSVCADLDMPADSTIWRWRHENVVFRDKLASARDEKQEAYADRIDALARRVLEEQDLDYQRVRVAIDGIDKAARLQAPKTRVELTGANNGPLQVAHSLDFSGLSLEEREQVRAIIDRRGRED